MPTPDNRQPTPRQRSSAANLAFTAIAFEGRTLTALEAVVLMDDLRKVEDRRWVALRTLVVETHNAIRKAEGDAVVAAARREMAARTAWVAA